MKIISVNVGLPRTVRWKGETVSTGIFKTPVSERITLRPLNLDGDRQADLTVHGGPNKAVYAYPAEHYPYWRQEYPDMAMPWGMFGENLTTEGLHEDLLQVGDRLRIGSAEIVVTEPRMPCVKLGLKFGRDDIIKRFLTSGRTGFYFRVITEGGIQAGDPIVAVARATHSPIISDDKNDLEGLRRISNVTTLPEDWRDYFKQQISRVTAQAEHAGGGGRRDNPYWKDRPERAEGLATVKGLRFLRLRTVCNDGLRYSRPRSLGGPSGSRSH
jgi:MOSC domain-containing protein YiiM